MKKNNNFLLVFFLTALSLGMLPAKVFGQLGDPGDDPDAPIDGGVSLLVAAGVGYGIKKAKDQRRKNKTADFKDI